MADPLPVHGRRGRLPRKLSNSLAHLVLSEISPYEERRSTGERRRGGPVPEIKSRCSCAVSRPWCFFRRERSNDSNRLNDIICVGFRAGAAAATHLGSRLANSGIRPCRERRHRGSLLAATLLCANNARPGDVAADDGEICPSAANASAAARPMPLVGGRTGRLAPVRFTQDPAQVNEA